MKLPKSFLELFLILPFCGTLTAQGRVDTDPILSNIQWITSKIENDQTTTKKIYTEQNTSTIYFYKKSILCKIVNLARLPSGTQMKASYYNDNKPIFISVKRNNKLFTNNQNQISKIISSFDDFVDTSELNKQPPYNIAYQAIYYFTKGKVRYVNVRVKKVWRVDRKEDVLEALKLYHEAENMIIRNNSL